MCFVSFGYALNIVNHRILGASLTVLGASPKVEGWVWSFLVNRFFQGRIYDVVSEKVAILSDIPQGFAIVPLLVPVLMNNNPRDLQQINRVFADDSNMGGRIDCVS